LAFANENLNHYTDQGKHLGRSIDFAELSQQDIEKITPNDLKGKEFDGEQARKELEKGRFQEIGKSPKTAIDPSITAVLENAENAMKQPVKDVPEFQETIEKCILENQIIQIALHHTLNVEVIHKPKVMKNTKICKGHYEKKKSRNPQKDKKKKKKKLAADPTIKWFDVYIDKQGFGHRDEVVSEWKHYDDVKKCNSYRKEEKEIAPESWEEIDTWNLEKPEWISSSDCKVMHITKGPPETRVINGREVRRPFWEKREQLQCIKQQSKGCDFLKNRNCVLFSETCLEKIGNQCLVFEKIFKCRSKTAQSASDLKNIYGSDPKLWEIEMTQNQTFPDAATKLAVLDQMKKELLNANASDTRSLKLFSGSEEKCSKSTVDNVMYDCCDDMDGLATKVKLSQCTSDEIALAESRAKGLTHYIGIKKEKFLGLWVSRKDHIFCVFSTKLSRVFQEEARKQLNIGWGDPDSPDCRGLTHEEIKKLDFSKMNLLEAFEVPKEIDNQEKIKRIEERLKQRINSLG
jgi:conjugal transfer mating pair stabilization protein TraN